MAHFQKEKFLQTVVSSLKARPRELHHTSRILNYNQISHLNKVSILVPAKMEREKKIHTQLKMAHTDSKGQKKSSTLEVHFSRALISEATLILLLSHYLA